MIGKNISHYKILEKLGGGGMGVVYKAKDTKLKRTVALKFLPPDLTRDPEAKERFVHEAQAASALQHNNIGTIHDIDETEAGQMFICMDYYAGDTLRKKIEQGLLKIDEAIHIVVQTAQGLAKAHGQGIVHRDIKPANVIVTNDGVVKIVDFGLAKLAGQSRLTKASTTMGTVAYMSPEQTRGEEVDYRTDIWSLGVVLYEMLTGKLPFKGDYEQAVVYSILNEEPEPLMDLRPEAPPGLGTIISKCLEKEPSQRYQQAEEVIRDLESLREKRNVSGKEVSRTEGRTVLRFIPILLLVILLAVAAGYFVMSGKKQEAPELHALAVLPFSNIRSDPETDFLGFALADQIIGDLTYLKSISVRPSSSIREYQNRVVNAQTAGNDLKVDYVLTGNYLKQANDMRLNVELVNVHTNQMIWREPIEVEYENAFKLQDMVSEKVIQGLRVQFSAAERDRMEKDIPQDPLAYEFYLRSLSYPSSIEGNSLAIEMLNKSIHLDSTYAPTFAELGFRTERIAQTVLGAAEEYKKAEQYYLKALSLNDGLLSALNNLAGLYAYTRRTEKAMELAQEALRINPNNAGTHFTFSAIYRHTGLLDGSEREAEIARRLHPNNPRFRSVGLTTREFMSIGA